MYSYLKIQSFKQTNLTVHVQHHGKNYSVLKYLSLKGMPIQSLSYVGNSCLRRIKDSTDEVNLKSVRIFITHDRLFCRVMSPSTERPPSPLVPLISLCCSSTLEHTVLVRLSTTVCIRSNSATLYAWVLSGSEAISCSSFSSAFFTPFMEDNRVGRDFHAKFHKATTAILTWVCAAAIYLRLCRCIHYFKEAHLVSDFVNFSIIFK